MRPLTKLSWDMRGTTAGWRGWERREMEQENKRMEEETKSVTTGIGDRQEQNGELSAKSTNRKTRHRWKIALSRAHLFFSNIRPFSLFPFSLHTQICFHGFFCFEHASSIIYRSTNPSDENRILTKVVSKLKIVFCFISERGCRLKNSSENLLFLDERL